MCRRCLGDRSGGLTTLDKEYQQEYQNSFFSSLTHESWKSDTLIADFFLSPILKFPFQDVTVQVATDGGQPQNYQLGSLDADYVYSDGGNYYDGYAYRQLGDRYSFYLRSYSYGGCSDAVQAQLYHSAGDYVYHSESHDFYWGTYNYDYEYHNGTHLDAASSFEIRFVLKHDAGTFGGTTGSIPIYSWPFNYEGDYEFPDGFYRYYDRGENFHGTSAGTLTP